MNYRHGGLAIQLLVLAVVGVLGIAGGATPDVGLGMILGFALGIGLALTLARPRNAPG